MLRLNLLCKNTIPPSLTPAGRMDKCGGGGGGGGGGAERQESKEKEREYDGDSKQQERQTECLSLLRSSGQEE